MITQSQQATTSCTDECWRSRTRSVPRWFGPWRMSLIYLEIFKVVRVFICLQRVCFSYLSLVLSSLWRCLRRGSRRCRWSDLWSAGHRPAWCSVTAVSASWSPSGSTSAGSRSHTQIFSRIPAEEWQLMWVRTIIVALWSNVKYIWKISVWGV